MVAWLREQVLTREEDDDDEMNAYSLAMDFVRWTDGEDRRRDILHLFEHDNEWESIDDFDDTLDIFDDDEDMDDSIV